MNARTESDGRGPRGPMIPLTRRSQTSVLDSKEVSSPPIQPQTQSQPFKVSAGEPYD